MQRPSDVQLRGEHLPTSLRKEQRAARVSVAAAVDALESRCRWVCGILDALRSAKLEMDSAVCRHWQPAQEPLILLFEPRL